MKNLKEEDYIVRNKKNYDFTSSGILFSQIILNYINSKKVLEEFSNLWCNHIVSDIPRKSINEIYALNNSNLLYSKNYDVYSPENYLIDNMEESTYLYAIIPKVILKYADLISLLLKNNVPVYLIFPKTIIRNFIDLLDDDLINNPNLHVFFSDKDLKLNLFINDFMFCLNLFRYDNSLDEHILLVSDDSDAVKWAKSLYFNIFDVEKVNSYTL